MKLRGTPEELEEAKQWWAEQKERINKEYEEVKKIELWRSWRDSSIRSKGVYLTSENARIRKR